MQQLHLKYSVYTLDLLGFGDSAKNPEKYSIDAQVDMLITFMDNLGIPKAAFIGHGLGAMVVTELALRHPDKVARAVLTSLPLFDPGDLETRIPAGQSVRLHAPPMQNPKTTPPPNPDVQPPTDATLTRNPLKDAGILPNDLTKANRSNSPEDSASNMPTVGRISPDERRRLLEAARKHNSSAVPAGDDVDNVPSPLGDDAIKASGSNPLLGIMRNRTPLWLLEKAFKRSEAEFDKLKTHVDKSDGRAVTKSVETFDAGQMLDKLRLIEAPALIVHGQDDPILPVPEEHVWNYLTLYKDDSRLVIPLPDVRHFPMLEYNPYSRLVMDFLGSSDISKLEIRERWKRRSY
jgi:pimeloyl-ACP methyl ester carboxylesterase